MKVAFWFAVNAGICWLAWLAVHGSGGAANLLAFISWFFAVVYWANLGSKDLQKNAQSIGRTVPQWVSILVDGVLIGFLVWHGFWWTGIALTLSLVGYEAIFNGKTGSREDAK